MTPQNAFDIRRISELWAQLRTRAEQVRHRSIRALLTEDPKRTEWTVLNAAGLQFDFSKTAVDQEIFKSLIALAEAAGLKEFLAAQQKGELVNFTERRAVLHTVLRSQKTTPLILDGTDIRAEVREALARMERFCSAVHEGAWTGYDGRAITDVVSIGIGGSYLGPRVAMEALRPYWLPNIRCHYAANVDAADLLFKLDGLDAGTTLFVIQSKTFRTQETLTNAETAKRWFLENGGRTQQLASHFVAVSTNREAAARFGVADENIFPMWDWVGGRYSLWSAIGLPTALQVGMDNFRALLAGAAQMDEHFQTAPFEANLPVVSGLLGVWHQNFLGAASCAILPYDQSLENLPAHLQQLDMESNGKRVNRQGKEVNYATGAVVWGGAGTNGQHAFHQLLHQGTRLIPAEFILPLRSHRPSGRHQAMLVSNCLAQSQAMMDGKSLETVLGELEAAGMDEETARALAPHKVIPGNRPNTMLLCKQLTPLTLGALIAFYEQRVLVQGVIWNINSFDQWGVELGKQLSDSLLPLLESEDVEPGALGRLDPATRRLVSEYRKAHSEDSP